ncbi:MAG: pirin family protein [Candidatus Aenigmarchaeota archaeon]|nr:pirin family protein [Candidatus Aenigmarchaeota archaeon]
MSERKVALIRDSKPTIEGAGVHLRRAFSHDDVNLDPFLLLDDFHSNNPEDYMAGFPWHPHRGIETVTYVLNGAVEHQDSLGNKGIIKSGDVQWMTAGSGIVHHEMPQKSKLMQGFQLWINLPAKKKMTDPKYRDIKSSQIPEVKISDGVTVKVIAGKSGNAKGPVKDLNVDVEYFHIKMKSNARLKLITNKDYSTFVYVIKGKIASDGKEINEMQLAIFSDGDNAGIDAKENSEFIFVSGKPLKEPVAWHGPIVMNTQEQLEQAFRELENNTFIKKK